ncbi:MAG: EscU/YscU/HrcU family type III secretion system export apparatus switch protein [Candidatus Hydrogenedentota bacterium]
MSDSTPKPTRGKKAVALHYDKDGEGAPKIIATGAGYIAEKILTLAKEHDIHIHEDPDLVNILAVLDLSAEIPEHLFKAVAEILAFVYQLNRELAQ